MRQEQKAPERIARQPLLLRLDGVRRHVIRVIKPWEAAGVAGVVWVPEGVVNARVEWCFSSCLVVPENFGNLIRFTLF